MSSHIYTAAAQQATHLVDRSDPAYPVIFECSPRSLIWADCCQTRRWAKHMVIQVYFDGFRRSCAPGHGCRAKGRR